MSALKSLQQGAGGCIRQALGQMSEESSVLEVHNLKRAVGDRVILTNLSFTVNRGDILFVRGPSGVGKSLLLRALAYLDPIQVRHAGSADLGGPGQCWYCS